MRLHQSAINKLVSLMNTYGGSPNEIKLIRMIQGLDFTAYERKTTDNQEVILVLTEDYIKELNGKKQ